MNEKYIPTPRQLRGWTEEEFKANPKMMAEFASYEEYLEKIVRPFFRLRSMMEPIEEEIMLQKTEPIEAWQIKIKETSKDE
ncbi:hypothetical protein ES703_44111 [subsurface metagenome]